ncbi:hypothetical protein K458DRAFT_25522 [Lentithecium fluviatile CBS 122367]|uniref:Uncharacterized protein n=1 Tax=Lentithecium fluviatile CBS 122367 TaxID=1168545 RepID=A0A6G1J2Q7_9PLEO|nr:hypothetical protein K458DRAFT_25522 [Lentithecium fluviatile CBS 122367]
MHLPRFSRMQAVGNSSYMESIHRYLKPRRWMTEMESVNVFGIVSGGISLMFRSNVACVVRQSGRILPQQWLRQTYGAQNAKSGTKSLTCRSSALAVISRTRVGRRERPVYPHFGCDSVHSSNQVRRVSKEASELVSPGGIDILKSSLGKVASSVSIRTLLEGLSMQGQSLMVVNISICAKSRTGSPRVPWLLYWKYRASILRCHSRSFSTTWSDRNSLEMNGFMPVCIKAHRRQPL